MTIKITCNLNKPPLGGLAVAQLIKKSNPIDIEWGNDTIISFHNNTKLKCNSNNDILRALARDSPGFELYGKTPIERTQIDHWLSLSLFFADELEENVKYLQKCLEPITYLVANKLTIADFAIFEVLSRSYDSLPIELPNNVKRWYDLIQANEHVIEALKSIPASKGKQNVGETKTEKTGERKQEGKFVDLPGAEMGKVVVRFPPEASGYLHIGHAKAALLNQYYQQAFQGKLIMRFDDTNPAKENVEFEKVILEDLEMLQIKPDIFTHTSQYFDLMLEYCENLLKDGRAYVDDTEPEQMKKEREQRIESENRKNGVAKNIEMWKEMCNGSAKGQKCCVRAKIDMSSPNGCLRDPTIYRCKNEPHPRTGTTYKVYPTYDFACPIVDAIENVTHTLRTSEYHDRDEQFYWFIDALKLRRPYIWEYSRLNMTNTVLSKRKLTWFVEEGLVNGWDDPRFPTVRGILRRGMTVEGLKEFIIAQGSSKSVVFMEWDKIWAFNKKVIDPVAPRYTAIDKKNVVVNVKGAKKESIQVPVHPKNTSIGNKTVWIGPRIIIDYEDALTLKENENATFINWGNLKIEKIHKEMDRITSVDASLNLENKDFKKTVKLTWLCEMEPEEFTATYCVYFEHIISKPVLGKDEDFKQYIGHETKTEVEMIGDPELKKCKKGDIIQLQRRGFFKVDSEYAPPSVYTGVTSPIILFEIPDGHAKEKSNVSQSKAETPQKQQIIQKDSSSLNDDIIKQGNLVRDLKSQKAEKSVIDAAVKVLLELKADYKKLTSSDWKPGVVDNCKSAPTNVNVDTLINSIISQGNVVRNLKTEKAPKADIDAAVKVLLNHKANYKSATGKDWDPKLAEKLETPKTTHTAKDISNLIVKQGDIVRNLKSQKSAKAEIDSAVQILLKYKADYKQIAGEDWKPDNQLQTKPQQATTDKSINLPTNEEVNILKKIEEQGNKVRQLKADKAGKTTIDEEVKNLLNLKSSYKALTGKDWKPGMVAPEPNSNKAPVTMSDDQQKINETKENLTKKITEQGNLVRNLKSGGATKDEVDSAVKLLLDLKIEYKNVTGTDFPVAGRAPSKNKTDQKPKEKKEVNKETSKAKEKEVKPDTEKDDGTGLKKQTRLGLEAKKEENLPDWYSQVITKGELIEYYDVSGCYILRPWSFGIWRTIQNWFADEIAKLGVKEVYFPMFVSKAALEKEKTHIADFSPEVAWVTKSGDSDMAEPVAIRPTSETIMYPAFAKWIQSHRDLPLRLNQWSNVVRWEFKHPQPFLRTREFLWQEGHTAYSNPADAEAEVLDILDLYARIYTDLLAIPVMKGRKTEKEKFAGGDFTTTVEAYISASGRSIQGATSHHLGQNFSKMFEIVYEDPVTKTKQYVFQNSWGITTRTIGVVVMIHGDNKGLVLPPRVASVQVVVVPCGITANSTDEDRKLLQNKCVELEEILKSKNVRVEGDYRDNYSPGWKFNHWELKGVPIRIELGPKDIKANQFVAVRRDTGDKIIIARNDATKRIPELLEEIHKSMYDKAKKDFDDHLKVTKDWTDFCKQLDKKNVLLSPFCGDMECEGKIKKDSEINEADAEAGALTMGAKSLCIPFVQPADLLPTDKCIHPACNKKPYKYTMFGRSY